MRANLKPVECGVRVRRIVRQSVIAVRVVEHARKPGNERVRLHEESAGLGGRGRQDGPTDQLGERVDDRPDHHHHGPHGEAHG